MIFSTGQFITSGERIDGKNGRFLNIIIMSKKPTLSTPVTKRDPKSVTNIGIKKSNSLVISIMIIAAAKVLVKAERKVAVPQSANNPGWILNPNDLKISPKSLPKIEPMIKAGVIIPFGIASVVSINSITILSIIIIAKWDLILLGHTI